MMLRMTHWIIAGTRAPLPQATESDGNCLTVHASGSVGAKERDNLRDFARLQNSVPRVNSGTLAPDLLDTNAAPLSFRFRRALSHCGSHPARQHCVRCDSE